MSNQLKTYPTATMIVDFLTDHRASLRTMGVTKIGLFGSFVRGEQRTDSDVDLLFTMEPFTWAGWMDVWNFIEDGLGMTIDLVPEKDLRDEIRPQVLSEVRFVEKL